MRQREERDCRDADAQRSDKYKEHKKRRKKRKQGRVAGSKKLRIEVTGKPQLAQKKEGIGHSSSGDKSGHTQTPEREAPPDDGAWSQHRPIRS
jgi:hypothetical protein